MVTVSVVIPAYNASEHIQRAIGSVLSQTISDFELIVVDDCSTDNTVKKASSFDDDRITLIKHEENRGGSAARNTGIRAANGTYIALLDADDEWHRSKLKKQIDLITTSSEVVVTYTGYEKNKRDIIGQLQRFLNLFRNAPQETKRKRGGEELITDLLLYDFFFGGSSTLLIDRKTLLEIDGFDETFDRNQDWELLIRLLQHGKIDYVDSVLVTKHHSGLPSADALARSKEKLFKTFNSECTAIEGAGYDLYGRHYFEVFELYLREGNFTKAREYYRRASFYEPTTYGRFTVATVSGIRTYLSNRFKF